MLDSIKQLSAKVRSGIEKAKVLILKNKKKLIKMLGRFVLFLMKVVTESTVESLIKWILDHIFK